MLEQLNGRFDNMMKGPDRGGGGGGARGGGGGRPGGGAATKVETQIQQLSTMLTPRGSVQAADLAPINAEASPVTKRGSIGRHLPVSADEGPSPLPSRRQTRRRAAAAAPTLPPKLPPSWQARPTGRRPNRSTGESQWKPPAVEAGVVRRSSASRGGRPAAAYPRAMARRADALSARRSTCPD